MVESVLPVVTEAEQVKEVADCRRIVRYIRVGGTHFRVGEIVPAAGGHGTDVPVPLDELENGNVIRIVVRDVAGSGIRRNDKQRNARAIPEVVERLNITGVVITTAFVESNHDRRLAPD